MRLMHSERYYLNPRIDQFSDDPITIVNKTYEMFKARYSFMPDFEYLLNDLRKPNNNVIEIALDHFYSLIPEAAIERTQSIDLEVTEELIRRGILYVPGLKAYLRIKLREFNENGLSEKEVESLRKRGIHYHTPEHIKRKIERIKKAVLA